MSTYEVLILDGKECILNKRESKKEDNVEIITEKFLFDDKGNEYEGTLTTQIFPDGTKKIEDNRDHDGCRGPNTLIEVAANGDKKISKYRYKNSKKPFEIEEVFVDGRKKTTKLNDSFTEVIEILDKYNKTYASYFDDKLSCKTETYDDGKIWIEKFYGEDLKKRRETKKETKGNIKVEESWMAGFRGGPDKVEKYERTEEGKIFTEIYYKNGKKLHKKIKEIISEGNYKETAELFEQEFVSYEKECDPIKEITIWKTSDGKEKKDVHIKEFRKLKEEEKNEWLKKANIREEPMSFQETIETDGVIYHRITYYGGEATKKFDPKTGKWEELPFMYISRMPEREIMREEFINQPKKEKTQRTGQKIIKEVY